MKRRWTVSVIVVLLLLGGIISYPLMAAGQTQKTHGMGFIWVPPQKYSRLVHNSGIKIKFLTTRDYLELIQNAPKYSGRENLKTKLLQLPTIIGELKSRGIWPKTTSQLLKYTSQGTLSATSPFSVLQATLPSLVNNTRYLPPVGNQGNQGSCNAWSSTYYVYSYMVNWYEDVVLNATLNDTTHIFSPAYTYNVIDNGTDSGSLPYDAQALIATLGAVPLSVRPYNDSDAVTWPNATQYYIGAHHVGILGIDLFQNPNYFSGTGTLYIINLTNSTQFEYLKGLLAAGYIAQTAIYVYYDFFYISTYDNNIYAVNQYHSTYEGGHAVTMVGYDDNLSTPDGYGAWYMVNSWGTTWGLKGFWWYTYNASQDVSGSTPLSFGFAWIYVPRKPQPHHPDMLAYVKIDHPKRGEVIAGIYSATTGNPTVHGGFNILMENSTKIWFNESYFQYWIGYFNSTQTSLIPYYQDHPFPNTTIILDYSAAKSGLNESASNWYANTQIEIADKYQDGVTGNLTYFGFMVNTSYLHEYYTFVDTPTLIPENGTWLHMGGRVTIANYSFQSPPQNATINSNWVVIDMGSIPNVTSAVLNFNGTLINMTEVNGEYYYYNVTSLSPGTYTYYVTLTLADGKKVTLPSRKVTIVEKPVEYIIPDPTLWPSATALLPGNYTYINGTFVWKDENNFNVSPFTGVTYDIRYLEVRYNPGTGMLEMMVNLTPMSLIKNPTSRLLIGIDRNNDGKIDYYAVVDLSKANTSAGYPEALDIYNATTWQNIANNQSLFVADPTGDVVFLQIPASLLGITGSSTIGISASLYEHGDLYWALDNLQTSTGATLVTVNLAVTVPFFGYDRIGTIISVLLLLGLVILFRRR